MSFPLRERGLKSKIPKCFSIAHSVVPLAGTWIEIMILHEETHLSLSFPLRERGLKSLAHLVIDSIVMSFPLRERGLKWIIINIMAIEVCRSPCGNVD